MAKKKKNSTAALAKMAGLPRTIVKFFRESRDELKKVSWPTRQITLRYTVIVVIASVVVGAVIGGMDYILAGVLERVI